MSKGKGTVTIEGVKIRTLVVQTNLGPLTTVDPVDAHKIVIGSYPTRLKVIEAKRRLKR